MSSIALQAISKQSAERDVVADTFEGPVTRGSLADDPHNSTQKLNRPFLSSGIDAGEPHRLWPASILRSTARNTLPGNGCFLTHSFNVESPPNQMKPVGVLSCWTLRCIQHHGETFPCISLTFHNSFIVHIARKRPELNNGKTRCSAHCNMVMNLVISGL